MSNQRVHFIGIGGIGVSALARLYRSRGFRVSGSDLARSEITDALRKEGIRVSIGPHRASNVPQAATRVIYTAAVSSPKSKLLYYARDREHNTTTRNRRSEWQNPEMREALRRGIPVMSYAEALGEVSKSYRAIAAAGAHGKSTTTALIGLILRRDGLDPTVIVGTKLREFRNSNFRAGRSPWLVLEADEYRASFLSYAPNIAVVTNIDREHLDYYRTLRNIEAAFLRFLLRLAPNGSAILNRDDPRLRRIAARLRRARPDIGLIWYSLRDPAAKRIQPLLLIPGAHNVSNAMAAYAVGRLLRIPEKKILSAISSYRGAWRRFQDMGAIGGARVIADYAHHPTEIRATLQAARERFPKNRIWCVFQPHHYERTRDLFKEFVAAFDRCDGLILLDIYEVAGRERKRRSPAVSSAALARAISRRGTPALYLAHPARLQAFLTTWLEPGDVILMMGAGDIWGMTKELMRGRGKGERGKVRKLA